MRFSALFTKAVMKTGKKKKDIARELGVTGNYITNLCNADGSTKPPTFEFLEKFIEINNVPIRESYYLYHSAFSEKLSESDKKYIQKINEIKSNINVNDNLNLFDTL